MTLKYSVINKEGHKVLGYKTIKKCDSDASKKFIASKNMEHFANICDLPDYFQYNIKC